MNKGQMYTIVSHNADNGGCGHYRMKFPAWAAHTLRKDIRIIESSKLIPIPEFYADVRMVRVQRQASDGQCNYILNFLKPLSERYGFWLAYEIDDVMGKDDIPQYNSGWGAYQAPQLMENVRKILQVCDVVTVTTPALGDYYHRKFGVEKSNIYTVPNYLPRWWIGDSYNEDKIRQSFRDGISAKPRIAFLSSVTHFDIFNRCDGQDDFSHVIDLVRATTDKYHWIFVGGCPQQLKDLKEDCSIEVHAGFDLLNYPHIINGMNLNLLVAPLRDNVFNNCKSNIKFLEMSALGIPAICQDLEPYRPYTDLRFRTADDLQNQIDHMLSSEETFMDTVKRNRDVVCHGVEGVNDGRGWWLESNMDRWLKLFTIQQKTFKFDLTKYRANVAAAPKGDAEVEEIKFEV